LNSSHITIEAKKSPFTAAVISEQLPSWYKNRQLFIGMERDFLNVALDPNQLTSGKYRFEFDFTFFHF